VGDTSVAEFVVLALFSGVLVVLAVIDARTRRLPNRIVLPAAGVVLAAQVAIAPGHALEWVLAALGAFLVMFLAHLAYPAGLGLGDVKLALLLGAALGWAVGAALALGFVAAAVVGLGLLVRGGWGARKRTMPLGPFFAAGGLVAAGSVVF
jgi:leader peptidase (prepilin peptidase) / N-methyltransferase